MGDKMKFDDLFEAVMKGKGIREDDVRPYSFDTPGSKFSGRNQLGLSGLIKKLLNKEVYFDDVDMVDDKTSKTLIHGALTKKHTLEDMLKTLGAKIIPQYKILIRFKGNDKDAMNHYKELQKEKDIVSVGFPAAPIMPSNFEKRGHRSLVITSINKNAEQKLKKMGFETATPKK
jgi:hypothetical protein